MKKHFAIVGMKHRNAEALVASLPPGEPLTLVREPNNKYDPNAVQVWARDQHVGYVKGTQARGLAMAMDRGHKWRVPPAPEVVTEGAMPADAAASKTARATLARSPNSGYPMAEVEE